MRNLHKLLIVLISVAFLASGTLAQSDASPKIKNQMERKVKPAILDNNTQVMGATERAPNDYELMVQSELGYLGNSNQGSSSVLNTMLFEYKMAGDQSAATELIQNAANPPNYKVITLNIDGATAYAFVAYDPSGTLPTGPATFDAADPGTIASLGPQTSNDFIAGGSWADDVWYGVEYGTGALYTMDISSGAMVLIGTANVGFNGMAYDPSTSTMYACTGDVLYTVDLSTGAATMVGTIQTAGDLMIGLACSAGGELYATDIISDVLYSIDPATGAGTIVGPLGIDISYAQSLEYDNENDVLYAGAYTTTGELYTIDPATGTATYVGEFQGGSEMCALAFPYSAVSYDDDLGIQSIIDPSTGVELTAAEVVTVRIKNYGTNAQSNFEVWFTLDGGTAVSETISSTLNAGETMDHTFATTVDLSAYGTYEFESCVVLSGDQNPGNDCKVKTVENLAPSYCDASTNTEDEWIANVLCGDIDNSSGWQGGVADYTDQFTIIGPGMSEDITVENGNAWTSDIVYCWVDWNDNYVFEQGGDEEFQLENVGGAGQTFTGAITVPGGAIAGDHRMRVRMTYSIAPEPCGNSSYGEVEDYTIMVAAGEYGIVEGYVTVNTGGAPIDGAMISVNNGTWTTSSGSDGYYEIVDVLAGDWDISCMATGYNPAYGTVTITNGGTTTYDFAMLAPTMDIDPLSIDITIDPNTMAVEYIDISNNGDGILDWDASLELLTDNTDAMFDLIWEVPVGVGGGEAGVETNGNYIYTTKWNGTGEYYRYGMDGSYIEQITVAGAAGTRDMAYDGTYFYGAAANTTVFQLDLDGASLISTFTAPTDCRAIAYNEDDGVFYANNWGSDITAFDMAGTNLGSFPVGPVGDSYYGLAYDNYSSPGTPYLWGLAQVGASLCELIQIELPGGAETGLTFDVGSVLSAFASAGGMCIDNNVSTGLWAFVGTCQNINLWALELGIDSGGGPWITIDPNSGTVDPGNTGIMDVNFDATDIIPGTVKTANIHFTSDPDVGMVTVPVTMTVGDQDFGYIEGNVTLDGTAPYNIGDVTEVLVEAGPYTTYPDASGDYQITAYPGTYDVVASLYGYETQTVPGIVVAAAATVTGVDFTLPILYGRLMGTVTDDVTGDPIENATISVIDTDFETMTAADGTYEIIIEAGTYDVMANHPTYMAEVALDIDVTEEADTQLDFELQFQIQCQFSVVLWDDYGDGWNGGTLTISVDGTVVLNNITLATGFGPETFYFDVGSGAEITCTYVGSGWPYENYYYIYDNDDNEVFADGLGGVEPTGGTFTGTCIVFIYGDLAGTVTESGSGNPIEGAEILIDDMTDVTAADGTYLIEGIMIGTWDVYCNAVGYNPAVATGVEIFEEQVTVQDFELDAPDFTVDPLTVNVTLEPNAIAQEVVTLSNPGNGTIDWNAAIIVLEDDATDDMFDLIWEVPVGVGGGEAGIETNGNYIYTTKWNGTGEYYRYGMDGSYIEQITVSGAASTRDMAYDGTYFYGGAASPTVFELDLDNASLISTFTAPTDCRAIAYNNDDDSFYANNWGSNITKFDKTGANLGNFPVGPVGDSYYGFAYNNSEGAPYLWGYAQVGATQNELVQIALPGGTETGLTFDVGSLLSASDIAGGLAIDDHIAPGLWAFLGTCQNVNLWAVELGPAGPVWLTIDPTTGTLDPGATQDMDLYFDATDLLPGVYEAQIHFSTDPNVGEPVVEVTLTVEGLIPAINLQAIYSCTDVELTWEMPTGGDPDSWNVYRDDVLIGDATVMSYTDAMVDPGMEYSYTVKAVYAGEESQPSSPALITVPTPADLEALDLEGIADIPNENDVTLTWEEPAACLAPDSYSIYRDNTMIADGVTGLEYVDGALSAGFYEYYVVAVYYFGDAEASDPAYVLITGIEDYDASLFQIFPNPAAELVNIKSPVEINRIHVLNNNGQLVLDKEVNNMEYQINVSKYEAGIYFIKLETSEGFILRKVAVK